MARDYATENPAFTRSDVAGTEANHSSTRESVAACDHAQSDDDLQNVPPPQDPNLSGRTPTEDTYTWESGGMSAWQENDDYRKYLEAGEVAESATAYRHETVHDGDYDDNGGIPTAIGHSSGHIGPAEDLELAHGTLPSAVQFSLGSVIVRRI